MDCSSAGSGRWDFQQLKAWVRAAPVIQSDRCLPLRGQPVLSSRPHLLTESYMLDQSTQQPRLNQSFAAGSICGAIMARQASQDLILRPMRMLMGLTA